MLCQGAILKGLGRSMIDPLRKSGSSLILPKTGFLWTVLSIDAPGLRRQTPPMSKQTDIQWCDSTVNPIMGCGGCELFPSPGEILPKLDGTIREHAPSWKDGSAKTVFKSQITAVYNAIAEPGPGHRNAVTTTNLWHFRESFVSAVRETAGLDAAEAARGTLAREVTCYAAKLHLNKGASLLNPDRQVNEGYAATFEQLRQYPGRVEEASRWSDLKGTADPDRPWIDGLPRLIFVSDMGDDRRDLVTGTFRILASHSGKCFFIHSSP